MTTISIRDNEDYTLVTNMGIVTLRGFDISVMVNNIKPKDITPELRDMYISLSRSIEESDDLRFGIVIGQVLSKLNEIINEVN